MVPEGMKALVHLVAQAIDDAYLRFHDEDTDPGTDDEEMFVARALLAPDGRLWPALRALGTDAADWASTWDRPQSPAWRATFDLYLDERNVTGPLADACLAAAEVPSCPD